MAKSTTAQLFAIMNDTYKSHFPWKTTILSIALVSVVTIAAITLLRGIGRFKTGRITTTFISDVPTIISTHGKVLELVTTESTEFFEKKDALYRWGIYVGENVARIRVP